MNKAPLLSYARRLAEVGGKRLGNILVLTG